VLYRGLKWEELTFPFKICLCMKTKLNKIHGWSQDFNHNTNEMNLVSKGLDNTVLTHIKIRAMLGQYCVLSLKCSFSCFSLVKINCTSLDCYGLPLSKPKTKTTFVRKINLIAIAWLCFVSVYCSVCKINKEQV